MSRFTDVLLVSPLGDGRTWVIKREFGYDIGAEGSGNSVEVPVGFMTDFASVPRPFWIFIPQWGKYGNAAVIHDYLYYDQARPRKDADAIFYEAMGVLAVPAVTKHLMYRAVKYFGIFAWNGNKKRKTQKISKLAQDRIIKSVEKPAALRAKM